MLATIGAALLLSALLVRLFPSPGPPPPIEAPDIATRQHEVLKRSNLNYGLRLASLKRLREAKLAYGPPEAVEDELLTAARTLLRSSQSDEAVEEATRRVAVLVPRVTALCSKAGITVGPAITAELIRARCQTPEDQRRLGRILAEYYFAELLRALVHSATAPRDEAPPEATPEIQLGQNGDTTL